MSEERIKAGATIIFEALLDWLEGHRPSDPDRCKCPCCEKLLADLDKIAIAETFGEARERKIT